jgi:hypothetical protein
MVRLVYLGGLLVLKELPVSGVGGLVKIVDKITLIGCQSAHDYLKD